VIVSVSAISAVVGLVVARLRIFANWLGRNAILAVDPSRKVLKFAAFAAEGEPGRLRAFAPAKDAQAGGHRLILL